MDSHDIFQQLTKGARFRRAAPALQKESESQSDLLSPLQHMESERKVDGDNDFDRYLDNDSEEEVSTFNFLSGGDSNTSLQKKFITKLTQEELELRQKEELIALLRKDHLITVRGKNIPPPVATFAELHTEYNLSERLIENLATATYAHPTPIQMQAMPLMLQQRNVMASAPTGSGKTIAFLAPILNDLGAPQKCGFRAVVLAPTRELAAQIYRECVQLAQRTALKIHFSAKMSANCKLTGHGSQKYDILISTPNRVRYMLEQEPPLIKFPFVQWLVIDEADRLMEEGLNNFKDQVDVILAACTKSDKKLALFSATYTASVAKWAIRNLKNLARVIVGQENTATNSVRQELLFVGSESGKLLAIRDLVRKGLKPPVLVFVQSKERAKELFQELLYDGINVDVIHAERTQQQRDNCVRAFREGKIWVLICTELMGRGIDFKGVNLVINYDFPPSVISYIHRIGRTGRAGRRGKAITFFTQSDTANLKSIAQIIKDSNGKVPDFILAMKKPRKSEKKWLANHAPKRESISTQIKPPKAAVKLNILNTLKCVQPVVKRKRAVELETDDSEVETTIQPIKKPTKSHKSPTAKKLTPKQGKMKSKKL